MDVKLAGLIALIFLASGCTTNQSELQNQDFTQDSKNQTSNLSQNPQEDNTVVLTRESFQPTVLTVEKGSTVTWVNNGSGSMWVASDRHPTHTEYSGSNLNQHCSSGDQTSSAFDQCSVGDNFTFTFEKTGEWTYHNHRNPLQAGKISVTS